MTHHSHHSHHPHHAHAPGRRRFLRNGAALAAALGAGTFGNLVMGTRSAYAADYKALICVFLYGGNDGMNMVVPTDAARYNAYAAVRGGLAIPRASLVPLPGISYGMHPAMSALSPVAARGHLAPVFNVGPLKTPLTKAQYLAASGNPAMIPDSLFSHADQQTLWETGTANSKHRTGWGGRASQVLGTTNPVISVGGTARFGISDTQNPLVLPAPGGVFGAYTIQPSDLGWSPIGARKAAIDALYAQSQDVELADVYNTMQRDAFAMSDRLSSLIKTTPGTAGSVAAIDNAFASVTNYGNLGTPLAQQLYQIAKLVSGNATVQGNRQMFFASMGGFDTHSGQVNSGDPANGHHGAVLKQMADAVAAFDSAMTNLGLADKVTLFTQSDFGRTFQPNNSSGTDHAWGNHHLVIGGAVKGGAAYGTYPELTLGGVNDVGMASWEQQGRWIPSSSVDQYAATLLNWFGASGSQLDATLPNLANFSSARSLGFV